MISFRQFLTEAEERFTKILHYNPSIATVKNIAKANPSRHTRFVIHSNKDWSAGNAMMFTHDEMGASHGDLIGHVFHENGKYHYGVWTREEGKGVVTSREHHNHPIIKRLQSHGITEKATSLFPGPRDD